MYNKLRSVILLAYKEEVCRRTKLDFDGRHEIHNDIDELIEVSLRNYVDDNEYFTRCHLRYGNSLSILNAYGFYNPMNDEVVIDNNLRCLSSGAMLNDLELLSLGINTFLHEHRHAYQYAHKLDILNHPLANKNNPDYVYELNPLEIDANKFADKYEMDAVACVIDSIESWFGVKYTEDIVEEDIRETVEEEVYKYYESLNDEELDELTKSSEEDEDDELTSLLESLLEDEEVEEYTVEPDKDIEEWFRQYNEQFGEW